MCKDDTKQIYLLSVKSKAMLSRGTCKTCPIKLRDNRSWATTVSRDESRKESHCRNGCREGT